MPHRTNLSALATTLLMAAALGLPLAGRAAAHPHEAQSSPSDPAPTLPSTTAGKIAAEYIAAFNGTDQAVADWERAYRTPSRLKETGVDERVERVRNMRKDFGTLAVREVIESTDDSLLIAVAGTGGKPVGLRFILDAKNPGKLDFIEVSSGGPIERPAPVDRAEIASTVESVAKALEDEYVYPEVARKMGAAIRANLAKGAYDQVKNDQALARRLTEDLRAVNNDKHMAVGVVPADMRAQSPEAHGPAPFEMARDNYGFRKVEILPGNIGLVKFDFFAGVPEAHPTVDAALGFVAHCDAVIFDLRSNGGGSPESIRYITSYLFEEPTHLNDMIDRDGKMVEEWWTLKDVPGARLPAGTPVYVLTSSRTFSGGEEFTYNLKNLKRATIVGETTGGGAHPVKGERVGERFIVRVPYMRANNPISKTNWEGTGVEPDIKVPSGEALDRATAEARKAMEARGAHAKK